MTRAQQLEAAQTRLGKLDIARASPLGLARLATRGAFTAPRHLRLIESEFLDLVSGTVDHDILCITSPPQHGKSETLSRFCHAWYKGTFPHHNTANVAYNGDKAVEWGVKVRDALREWGPDLWGVSVATGRDTQKLWETTEGGKCVSAGLNGMVTGIGLHGAFVDDPIKNATEAESRVLQERNISFFQSALMSRLRPGGWIVVILTRWTERDLIGWLMDNHANRCRFVRLPAIAEEPHPKYGSDPLGRAPGEALWPEQRPHAFLVKQREIAGPSTWAALWQGRPAPPEGSMFKREWLRHYTLETDHEGDTVIVLGHAGQESRRYKTKKLERFHTKDTAEPHEEGDVGAYSVIATWLLTPDKDLILWDVVRLRRSEFILADVAHEQHRRHGGPLHVEKKSTGGTIIRILRSRGVPTREYHPQGSKVIRARNAEADFAAGKIWLPSERVKWVLEYEDEILAFPKGNYADQVDVTSHASIIKAERREPGIA